MQEPPEIPDAQQENEDQHPLKVSVNTVGGDTLMDAAPRYAAQDSQEAHAQQYGRGDGRDASTQQGEGKVADLGEKNDA